jgi:hypothetical protein
VKDLAFSTGHITQILRLAPQNDIATESPCQGEERDEGEPDDTVHRLSRKSLSYKRVGWVKESSDEPTASVTDYATGAVPTEQAMGIAGLNPFYGCFTAVRS